MTPSDLIAAAIATHGTPAAAARAIGLDRRALDLARRRNALTDSNILRAAAAAGLDPVATLLTVRATTASDSDTAAAYRAALHAVSNAPPPAPPPAKDLYYVK